MNELIRIQEHGDKRLVDARELHLFLEVKRDFSNWIKDRIEKYGFEADRDFSPILAKSISGRPSIEYALTLDTAKELAMVENNEKGRQARRYFIEVEKKAMQLAKPMSTLDLLEMSIRQLREQETRVNQIENKVMEIDARTKTRPDSFTIMGFASISNVRVGLSLAGQLGKKAIKLCNEQGIKLETIPDPRFGKVYVYPKHILQKIFDETVV